MTKPVAASNDCNRREFLRLTLLSCAALLDRAVAAPAGVRSPSATHGPPAPVTATHGALRELAPGTVRPEGWLQSYLGKQAELCATLPRLSWPFTESYWSGLEDADAWWPWEQVAYWIDGATRLALVLDDQALMALVRTRIDYTLQHTASDGFLGPQYLELSAEPRDIGMQRWPNNVMFRGLAALGDAAPAAAPPGAGVAEALRRHYVSDDAPYGVNGRNITNIEPMLWCYARTGDTRLLAKAETAWQQFLRGAAEAEHEVPADREQRPFADLGPARVHADTPIECHGVTYAECMKQPAILYLHTGKQEYLDYAEAAARRIFDHHMLIDGIPSTSEVYRTVTAVDQHETCDIADHTWSWGYLLMATGDSRWADRIERACFNAAPGAILADWKALQYLSSPNQFVATLNSDHGSMRHGGRLMAYQPNPGQFTACCGGNVHRIFPNFVIRMWMQTPDHGLAAVLYGPSQVTATVGAAHEDIEIVQTTRYPFEDQIELKINARRAVEFPLSLRIPGWCEAPRVAINGTTVSAARNAKGFVVLHRRFEPGDVLTLTLPMQLALTHWPDDGIGIGIEYGPLVYALPIKADWKPIVEPGYSSEGFPSLEARPASAWNYGLAADPARLIAAIEVATRTPSADEQQDPWSHPTTTLTVPARRIPGWELRTNPANPGQQFTPPLPTTEPGTSVAAIEPLTLVPYGSTQLRMSIFPWRQA
jgi:hypothetical protein